ncbi:thiolase family protein [Alicycliphilus denitrificans]|uniref:Thiolase family protein n=1 Tax=Alicycliphilus denitrificans TaxID=179636 RepID=A0A420KIJ9_9BURK|nr:thiolase family protein [Alicycliphilus denitrificans]RKJ99752.1 thiolase family protein [Alicycliphilus denitrificans]
MSLSGRYVIAGIGHTAFGKLPGQDTVSLNVEACRHALADACVDKSVVDAVFVKVPTSAHQFMYGQKVAEALGITPRMGGCWDQGGAANITLLSFAIMAIEAGQCDVALVCYADNPRSGNRAVYGRPRGDDAAYGWFSTAAGYGMIHRRHMIEYGTRPEDFAAVAIASRKHGAGNPSAQLRKPLDLEQYMVSPWVVDPLRKDDCALVSDGGAALVVMSAKRAKELGVAQPVPVLGFGHGQTSFELPQRATLTSTEAARAAHTAFQMAGAKPQDVDVAQLYDCFTVTVLMTLEDYGFCGKGEAGAFVRDGAIEYGGRLPVNTSGGLLSETGMPGLQLIMEGVRQMRGTARLQVSGAKLCVVSNQGGTMHTHGTLLLGN